MRARITEVVTRIGSSFLRVNSLGLGRVQLVGPCRPRSLSLTLLFLSLSHSFLSRARVRVRLLMELYKEPLPRYSFTALHGGRGVATYGYVRVSTEKQAEEGESLGAQRRTIEGYAMMQGLTLDEVFVERGVSGSKPIGERPEGARMLGKVRAGDVIITPKLDRMFRSALDALDVLARLKDRDVSLHMIDLGGDVTGNGISKLVFTILSAVAEAERDRTRERIADVKRDQRERGRFLGGTVPFGYRLGEDGELIPHEGEQEAIKEARAMKARGASLRAIAEALQARGHSISHVAVSRVLRAVC